MCGLAGCFGIQDIKTINRMLDALPHRGPDDRGIHVFNDGVFGHTRLSIVVQYTQGAGCESLGERLAESEVSEDEYLRIKAENPGATINSREAAYYFKIFRQFHPQDSVLGSIGIWTGFDFAEERTPVRGTMDGDLKHDHDVEEIELSQCP